jgi:hypothetical protein
VSRYLLRLLQVEKEFGVRDEPLGVLEVRSVVRVRIDDQLCVRQELLEDVRVMVAMIVSLVPLTTRTGFLMFFSTA